MSGILHTQITQSDYENVHAICPSCHANNIFNRVTDLLDTKPVANMEVRCQEPGCLRPFSISGDTVNPPHEVLLLGCYDLIKQKRYASSILQLAQAFEMFFAIALRVELVARPAKKDFDRGEGGLEILNSTLELLHDTTRRWTFWKMRNAFLHVVLKHIRPSTLAEASEQIRCLSVFVESSPDAQDIASYEDRTLRGLLEALCDSKTPQLRNDVIHKSGYRPSYTEVQNALAEARSILFGISGRMSIITDDLTYYF